MGQERESPPLGAAGIEDETSFPGGNDHQLMTPGLSAKQESIAPLRRAFVAESLRIAGVKALHASDDILLGDDICAEGGIQLAISHLKAAAAAFREMQNAGSQP